MITAIIVTYIALVMILFFWAWTDMAFTRRIKNNKRWFWWLMIFFFPVLGPILYFQNKDKRKFNPKFQQR